MYTLGIDIGGSSIKAALVATQDGSVDERFVSVPIPNPATPQALLESVRSIVSHFNYQGPIGCGFPGIIRQGIICKAAHLHPSWLGYHFSDELLKATSCRNVILNDAAAAGLAEVILGAAKGLVGSCIMVTLGTGIGTALFYEGRLFPNTELGHLTLDGEPAEARASAAAFIREKLTWEVWSARLNRYLQYLEGLFWPNAIIIGGGIAQNWEQFAPYLQLNCSLKPAHFGNHAGCIGAAVYARTSLFNVSIG